MGNTILAASGSSSGGSYFFLLIIVAVLVLMYFVTVRPQRNRQRQVMQTQQNVQPGQRVRTTAGMYATIVELDGNDVVLEVSPGVEMRFLRRAIMEVLPDDVEETSEYASDEYASDEEAEPDEETAQAADSDVTAEASDGETAPVADTASEGETTQEAPAAPNANGKSPAADEGRPAGR
ncbi:MAG TPA: preprotein translocase subunit YajC [Streptosporangiaceae bacterium]|jgi:preprotein translocase subunit YajC